MGIMITALAVAACSAAPRIPEPNPVTGLMGIPLDDPTILNGKWGAVVELATILTLPVVGDRNAGSQQLWLHDRRWDTAQGVYQETFRWCAIDVWEVEGNTLEIPVSTLEHHAPVAFISALDTGRGTFTVAHILDLWGWRNMPDPVSTPVPNQDNWQSPPQSDWIFDEDEDGQPATTGYTHGITGGEVRQVIRGQYAFDGTVVAEDRIQGLVTMLEYQQNAIDATNPLAKGESKVRQDPDLRATWFEMVKLPDDASCDAVKQSQADGRLASKRPF
jgi:hypothetical protein